MDLQPAVLMDEAQAPEFVHEGAHARSGSADHLGERFLADRRQDGLGFAILAIIRKQQKNFAARDAARDTQ